jgi:Flp pilus assembly CpaE family ATPase
VMFSPAPELAYQAAKQNQPLVELEPEGPLAQQFARLADGLLEKASQIA